VIPSIPRSGACLVGHRELDATPSALAGAEQALRKTLTDNGVTGVVNAARQPRRS